MRLGSQKIKLLDGSGAANIYKSTEISERHRHRYEVNYHFHQKLEQAGLTFTGLSKENPLLAEVVEINDHPWFIGCQFHPEFTSTPRDGHPLFQSFMLAAKQKAAED